MYIYIAISIFTAFILISFHKRKACHERILNTKSLIELKTIKQQVKSDPYITFHRRELIKKIDFWHQQIVNDSIYASEIDLDFLLIEARDEYKNLDGLTTSEDEDL